MCLDRFSILPFSVSRILLWLSSNVVIGNDTSSPSSTIIFLSTNSILRMPRLLEATSWVCFRDAQLMYDAISKPYQEFLSWLPAQSASTVPQYLLGLVPVQLAAQFLCQTLTAICPPTVHCYVQHRRSWDSGIECFSANVGRSPPPSTKGSQTNRSANFRLYRKVAIHR